MITEIKKDQLWHCDINNENATTAPLIEADLRITKIVSGAYITILTTDPEYPAILQSVKDLRFPDIDDKTAELILLGFQYNTYTFGLDQGDTNNITNMEINKANSTYPIDYPDMVDSYIEEITDATEVTAFYTAAFDKVRERKVSGTTLRFTIKAQTTVAGVDSVVDTRS